MLLYYYRPRIVESTSTGLSVAESNVGTAGFELGAYVRPTSYNIGRGSQFWRSL